MATSIPDWQLPAGVSRGLWDYVHDTDIAHRYDATLAGSPLLLADQHFAERHFKQPGRLIDLGCGTGRLLIPFAERGFWALGVDLSEEMLRQAGGNAARAGAIIHRLKANLVELDALCDGSFDYAACLFSTLGMIEGAANRQRVLEHVYRLLRPGGKFILHVHNRWFNVWDPQGRRWLLWDWLRWRARGEDRGDSLMPVHQGIAGLKLHLFTRREIVRMLRQAGFDILEVLPVGLSADGRLPHGWFMTGLRAYGYLIATGRGK